MSISTLLGQYCLCKIGEVQLDASVREVHGIEADVTEHPVESGGVISDHYIQRPRVVTIEGIISRTPIETGFPGASAISSVTNLVNGSDAVLAAWEEFKRMWRDSERFNIVTGEDFYTGMMFTSVSKPRVKNDWMVFNAVAKKVETAFTSVVEALAAQAAEAATTTAQAAQSAGAQAAEEAEGSILFQGAEALGIF
jgi:hypothetical protein